MPISHPKLQFSDGKCKNLRDSSRKHFKNRIFGTSLVVQWLTLHASTAGGMGSLLGSGVEFPHATRCGQKIKKKFLIKKMQNKKFFFSYIQIRMKKRNLCDHSHHFR